MDESARGGRMRGREAARRSSAADSTSAALIRIS